MKLKGNLQIGLPQGSGEERIEISIGDDLSGVRVITIEVGLAEWTRALSLRFVECEFQLTVSDLIGKRMECKTIVIAHPCRDFYGAKEGALKAALVPHEIGGWRGDWEDFTNHHNKLPHKNDYRIRFVRWVEAGDGPQSWCENDTR